MARLALDVQFAPSGLRQVVKMPILQKAFGGIVMLTMISNMAGLGIPMAAGLVLGGVLGAAGIRPWLVSILICGFVPMAQCRR